MNTAFPACLTYLIVSFEPLGNWYFHNLESLAGFNNWMFFCDHYLYGVNDTTFYALNLLIVVRVYAVVVWHDIPVFIYQKIAKKFTKATVNIELLSSTTKDNGRWANKRNANISDRANQAV